MRRQDWGVDDDAAKMLEVVRLRDVRKLRLFGAACYRAVWPSLDARDREKAEREELLAEGRREIAASGLRAAHADAGSARLAAAMAVRAAAGLGRQGQVALVRDIFRDPSRPPVPIGEGLLCWNDSLIPRLARAAYENRLLPGGHLDRYRLVVLADALEDAGCMDAEVLAHLRSPGPHVRGSWCVDLLLAKE